MIEEKKLELADRDGFMNYLVSDWRRMRNKNESKEK